MKYILVAVLLLAAAMAQASPTMQAECERQMALGLCSVQLDANSYEPGARMTIGRRQVPVEAYLYVRNGDKAMCGIAARACAANPNSDVCVVARSRWGP